jgi:citrate lyase subunit beta/citryl-CoA lyase
MRPCSYLYVPGDSERKLDSAARSAAGAVMIDLEDAVVAERKELARGIMSDLLASADAVGGKQVWVRVGSGADLERDVAALAGRPGLHGIVMAKTESAADVRTAVALLETAGDHSTTVMPLLESGGAILRSLEIATAPRVECLQIGEVDLRADTGLHPGEDELELLFPRAQVVMASRAAGISAPIGPASPNFRDLDAFRASCERVRRLGFVGRACIHPRQIAVVHAVLEPTADEVDRARRLVASFEAARERGDGVLKDEDGDMVDHAAVRQAVELLSRVYDDGPAIR